MGFEGVDKFCKLCFETNKKAASLEEKGDTTKAVAFFQLRDSQCQKAFEIIRGREEGDYSSQGYSKRQLIGACNNCDYSAPKMAELF